MFKMILIKPQSYASTVSLKFRVLDLILSSPLVVGPALIPTASHLVEDIFLFSFSSSMEFQSGVCCPFPKDKGFCFLGELKRQILANFVSLRYPLLFSTSKHALWWMLSQDSGQYCLWGSSEKVLKDYHCEKKSSRFCSLPWLVTS